MLKATVEPSRQIIQEKYQFPNVHDYTMRSFYTIIQKAEVVVTGLEQTVVNGLVILLQRMGSKLTAELESAV